MIVHASPDEADFWADYKHQCAAYKDAKTKLLSYPLLVQQMFTLLDDLQQITHNGCVLDAATIGSIQAKLIILRIDLNVHFGVNTPQLHERRSSPGMAASMVEQ